MARRVRGSYYQRSSDGRWVASLPVRDAVTGKGRTVTRYAHPNSKEGAEALLAEMQHEAQQGLPVNSDKLKFATFADRWLSEVVRPNVTVGTYTAYEHQMRNHIKPYLGKIPLRAVGPEHVHDLQLRLKRKGLSETYIGDVKGVLSRCLRQAEAWSLVARNAATPVKAPRKRSREMRVWSADQVRTFLQHVRLSAPRREALYALCLTLGLRQGEAIALHWSDIDLERGLLAVSATLKKAAGGGYMERGEVKTASARRTLELPRSLVALLKLHRARQQEERRLLGWPPSSAAWVFPTLRGRPYWTSEVVDEFHADIRRVNDAIMQADPEAELVPMIRFHDMRHSCASMLYAKGVPIVTISKVLGHRNTTITMNVYTHLFKQSYKDVADVMDDLLSDSG